ncbi:MAG: molybdopterin-binding protein [Bacilli bacterium]
MKREIRVEDAVGKVLAHDLTKIVPGEFKGRLFQKGHVIVEKDIEQLLAIGKEHIYVLSLEEGEVHEDVAASRMAAAIAHRSLLFSEPNEGKVTVKSAHAGLLRIDVKALYAVNALGDLAVVTKRAHSAVTENQTVAGLRAIPLIVRDERLTSFETTLEKTGPLLEVLPFRRASVGVVTTGSEVYKGRIEDRFGPVLRAKLQVYGARWLGQEIVDDATDMIAQAIDRLIERGADIVLVTGGMSVDPDDRSPGAIAKAATEVVSYGVPMLPGSMSMLAYRHDVVLMGLPGCVIFDSVTAFDHLLPRVLAGQRLTGADIAELGHGGLL